MRGGDAVNTGPNQQGVRMDVRAVILGFFVLLAATCNLAFFLGDIDDPTLHHVYALFAALVVNIVASGLVLGSHTHYGATLLSTTLVADLQLITAVLAWIYAVSIGDGYTPAVSTIMVSMSGGALFANLVSVLLLVLGTLSFTRP